MTEMEMESEIPGIENNKRKDHEGAMNNINTKRSKYSSVNVDITLFDQLDALLTSSTDDINAIIEFINKHDSQLISVWTYYNTTNNHQQFTSCTIKLNKLFELAALHKSVELANVVPKLMQTIIATHCKTIYRSLSQMKPSITNPILKMLKHVVKYDQVITELINHFDFNLAILPKILAQKQYRPHFIEFWIAFLSNANHMTRKDFMINFKKINNGIYKSLIEDSENLITQFLTFLDNKILEERSYNKVLKLKFFNDFTLNKLISMYQNESSEDALKTILNNLLLKILTNNKKGILFVEDKIWTNSTTAHHKNKTIYNVLLQLKPFEDDAQLQLSLAILKACPNMIIYLQHHFQVHGANDPKLSSFWIGQTLFLQEVIKLPIPEKEFSEGLLLESELSLDMVLENIIPSSLTKSCLMKCLQCESLLIKQITVQLLLFIFAKLKEFIKILDTLQYHDFKSNLLNTVLKTKLPELGLVGSITMDNVPNDKKLLLLSFTMLINEYLSCFPMLSVSLTSDKFLALQDTSSGPELLILEKFLELQENNVNDTNSVTSKWWNSSKDKNCFYTNLLKIFMANPLVFNKILKILETLTSQTIIMDNDNRLFSQNFAILQSLKLFKDTQQQQQRQQDDDLEKVWKFLDESFARCCRTPYKYLDSARASLKSPKTDCLSPLVVTMFEQWAFVSEKSNLLDIWFSLLMRYLIICGENYDAIIGLFESKSFKKSGHNLDFQNYESQFINNSTIDKAHFKSLQDESFSEFVMVAPLSQLDSNRRIPTNLIDIIALIKRIELIIEDTTLKLSKSESTLMSLMEKLGNFLASSPIQFDFKYWRHIFISGNTSNDKLIFISRMLNDIFKQLNILNTQQDYKFSQDYKQIIYSLIEADKYQTITSEACWCLDDTDLISLSSDSAKNKQVSIALLREVISRNLSIPYYDVVHATEKEELDIINKLIEQDLLKMDYVDLLNQLKDQKTPNVGAFNQIIRTLIKKCPAYDISNIKDRQLLIICGSAINSIKNSDFLLKLINSSIDDFYNNFNLEYLQLLSNCVTILSKEQLYEILSRINKMDVVIHDAAHLFSIELLVLLENYPDYKDAIFLKDLLEPWLLKSLLYINRIIAQPDMINDGFEKFLTNFEIFFNKVDCWKFGGSKILNTQLEILLNSRLISEKLIYAKYTGKLIANCHSSKLIDFNKLLQIAINNEANPLRHLSSSSSPLNLELRFYNALIIHDLFYQDIKTNSSQVLQASLLQFYTGKKQPDAIIIKRILIDIEAAISFNLVNHFIEWEFSSELDEDECGPLIQRHNSTTGQQLSVTICKQVLNNSIKNYCIEDLNSVESTNLFERCSQLSNDNTYDDEFLLLLIINNEELFCQNTKDDEGEDFKIDLKKLIDSNLLQFIVINLINENRQIRDIAYKILSAIWTRLDEKKQGKNTNSYKVFIGNLLSLEYEHTGSIIYLFYGSLLPVLNNPSHFLFERASKFLLSSGRLKNDIPLFQEIALPANGGTDSETYYRAVTWFLETLLINLKNVKDFKILSKDKIIEWMMNLINNKCINSNIQNLILSVILKMVKLGGASLLCKSYGLLSWLSLLSISLDTTDNNIAQRQLKLNCEKISIALNVIVNEDLNLDNKKSLEEWFDNDLDHQIKKICTKY